jgi:hypothetical protein
VTAGALFRYLIKLEKVLLRWRVARLYCAIQYFSVLFDITWPPGKDAIVIALTENEII